MQKITITAVLCFLASLFFAQGEQKFWSPISENNISPVGTRQIVPQKYLTFHLMGSALKDKLWSAPNEKNVPINQSTCIIYLPIANGELQAFKVVESPIMEPGLAAQFPNMKTFSVKGIDDVYANGKLDWNEFGFHGMIRSINGDIFIDPYSNGNITDYITYYTSDFKKDPASILPEAGLLGDTKENTEGTNTPKKKLNESQSANTNAKTMAVCVGQNLRTYRFAVACTGEYAQAATGLSSPSIAQTLAKIVTTVNRVDGVYETEVSVRLVLVATETLVVYTSPGTDPFNGNNNASILIGESQTVCNSQIGSANYDIGHTFSTGGGGLAQLGCVCSSFKAQGITGSPSPVGDPYDIDYVAHEVGHQFGGNHTFNSQLGNCGGNRNGSTAAEPGSGVTIMGYAGICAADDIATNSIAYFHAVSYDEIVNFTNSGGGNSCAVTTTTGNNPPVVMGSVTYTVPKSTPYTLTGSATDPEGDALTYQWEETDLGPGSGGTWNNGNKPFWMSYVPSISPSRSFPKLSVIISGNMTGFKGEFLTPNPQTLNFRLTARDNKMGGGGVCSANSQVVVSSAGPFAITYPNVSAILWPSGSSQTITWSVNGTDLAPISCPTVDVYISYNQANTFALFQSGVANTGSLNITVPTLTASISTCRLKISCSNNIFFDINDKNFIITVATGINEVSGNNAAGLSVSPNPFSENITIKAGSLDADSETLFTITDVLGKVVKQESYSGISNFNKNYSLENLSRGLYFVTIKNGNKQSVARIVKN